MSQPALVEEIAYRDPADLFPALADLPYALFLDSAMAEPRLGNVSYIAVDPFRIVRSDGLQVTVDDRSVPGAPFDVLKDQLARFGLARAGDEAVPPFQGGAAGLFGYDLAWSLEALPQGQSDDMAFPELAVGFYDVVLAFDHNAERAWLISTGLPAGDEAAQHRRAAERAGMIKARLASDTPWPKMIMPPLDWELSDERAAYEAKVQRVIDYIYAGDIFQANLSQRFAADLPEGFDTLAFYDRLRRVNGATFCGYFDTGDSVIASSSPERFLKLEGGRVETRPIKGTRSRGQTAEEDRAFAADLLASEKDRAENVMIVDLLRNDLSKVCAPHTVTVPELCALESYASVHHLVSSVTGALKPGKTAVDLLAGSFPGGSITGAPKVRAMEIIAELENDRRGPYCGSLGYVSFAGDMDTSILIRTLCFRNNRVTFQAGGGIVADSDPALEYEETLVKANRLFDAFEAMTSGKGRSGGKAAS